MKDYIVWRESYGLTLYLYLDGPFQYPRWSEEFVKATSFMKATAFQWAELEGGRPFKRSITGEADRLRETFFSRLT